MKQVALDSRGRFHVEQAINAYQRGEADLSAAARFAGLSVYHMMTELEMRDFTPPVATEKFVQGLKTLVETFGGSEALRQTIVEVENGNL